AIITASRTGSIVRQLDELRKEVAVLRKALTDRTTPTASADNRRHKHRQRRPCRR
ncbi:MAG: hypothetical protein IPG74_14565, partial [Flavobacteriales bacterium]|nr:hypothetical protein [Flavobacteriales bacterium]